jgi:hypothetical protein
VQSVLGTPQTLFLSASTSAKSHLAEVVPRRLSES